MYARVDAVLLLVALSTPFDGCRLLKKRTPETVSEESRASESTPVAEDTASAAPADALDAAATGATGATGAAGDAGRARAATARVATDGGGAKAVVGVASAGAFAAGQTWSGGYVCTQGGTKLALHITSASPTVDLVFDFETRTGVKGKYKMTGKLEPETRHLALRATSWIEQPPNFVTVDLDGTVSADGHSFTGRVVGPPTCSTFAVAH
jgi:hypothetical protein